MSDAPVEESLLAQSGIEEKLELEAGETAEAKYQELLGLLRHGRFRLDELADGLGVSGVEVEYLVRVAEKAGDVVRDGYSGMSLYTIRLTDSGSEKARVLSDHEVELADYDLTDRDWAVLQILAEHQTCTAQGILESYPDEIAPVKLIPSVNHLVRLGYCTESGLWRRVVEITDKGRTVVDELTDGPT